MSPETGEFALKSPRAAKNTTLASVSTSTTAQPSGKDANKIVGFFSEIAGVTDILVGNEEDFQLCLEIKGPEAGGKDVAAKIESFRA